MIAQPTFGMVLGGGAARGSAHVGVLLQLERYAVRPDLIVGTSIGGIVGTMFSAGIDPDDIADFIEELRITRAFAIPRGLNSITSNRKLEKQLVSYLGRPKFHQLPVPVTVVATDLVNRSTYVINQGDVITGLLASAALPGLLPTVKRDGRILVDGGVTNNMPVDVARRLGASHILGTDLSNSAPFGAAHAPRTEAGGLVDRSIGLVSRYPTVAVLLNVLDTVMAQALRWPEEENEVFLRPKLGTIGLLDFHRVQEGIEAGRMAFQDREKDIATLVTQFKPGATTRTKTQSLNGNNPHAHTRH